MDVFLEGGIHFFTRYILLNGFIFFQWRPIGGRWIAKKQKRTLESAVTATATSSAPATATPVVEIKEVVKEVKVPVEVPAKNPAFYVQYQSAEYTVAAITERVIADCNAKGHAVENPEALSIYLKPEDKKAYYTLGGFNGYIEL